MVLLVIVALVVIGFAVWDMSARRKGHKLRKYGDMYAGQIDVQRDLRANAHMPNPPKDSHWNPPNQ